MKKRLLRLLRRLHLFPQNSHASYRGVTYQIGDRVIVRTNDPDLPVQAGTVHSFFDNEGAWMTAAVVIDCGMGGTTARSGVIVPYVKTVFTYVQTLPIELQWDFLAPEQHMRRENFGHPIILT